MNVTPLVDVVLVLLIIFMVVAPQLQQDVPVNLPGIFNPDPDVEGNMDPIKVSLDTAGKYYVEDQHYDLNGITQYLVDKHLADPDRRLVLRADQGLKYARCATSWPARSRWASRGSTSWSARSTGPERESSSTRW